MLMNTGSVGPLDPRIHQAVQQPQQLQQLLMNTGSVGPLDPRIHQAAQQLQQPQQHHQPAALPASVGPLDPRKQEAKLRVQNLFWHMSNRQQEDSRDCIKAFSREKIGKRSMAVFGMADQLKKLTTRNHGKSCAEGVRILYTTKKSGSMMPITASPKHRRGVLCTFGPQ
jgi:hypothetical protein